MEVFCEMVSKSNIRNLMYVMPLNMIAYKDFAETECKIRYLLVSSCPVVKSHWLVFAFCPHTCR